MRSQLLVFILFLHGWTIFALPQSEIDACNLFKASITPDPGWTGNDPCTWGLTFYCEVVNSAQHITRFYMAGPSSTEIGEWIADLPYLTELAFFNITFTKPISQKIAELPFLRIFYLSGKNIQLPVLQNILSPIFEFGILEGSDFSGPFPDLIRSFPNLTRLELHGTQIDGTLPSYLGDFPYLSSINVINNRLLGGTIPSELGQLSRLRFLYLFGNNLSGTIPPELGLPLLIQLHLDDNELTGTIPSTLAPGYISYQHFSNNQLTGTIPAEYGLMTYLYEFDVSGNKLTGTIPAGLKDLPYLRLFNVSNNPLSGCSNMTFVRADQCDVSSTNLCCVPTNPQCVTTAVKCVPCVQPPPSPDAKCQVNANNEAVWVIDGDLVLTSSVAIDNIIVNGNLTLFGDLTVSSGVIVVKGCPNINGTASLYLTLTPEEIATLTESGQIERAFLIFDAACDTSDLDFDSITVDGDASDCGTLQVRQDTKPGLVSIIVVRDNSACKSSNNGPVAPSLPDWGIAVIVVGAVLVAGAVILIALLVTKKNKKKESRAMTHKLSTGSRTG